MHVIFYDSEHTLCRVVLWSFLHKEMYMYTMDNLVPCIIRTILQSAPVSHLGDSVRVPYGTHTLCMIKDVLFKTMRIL